MIWHDHSTVANHGHLLFLATVAYDPAFHLTSQEYKEKTGKDIDIQEEVESPQVYIIARCSDTDVEQLAYSETRCECLKKLSASIDIQPGIPISDKMRFCKGDGPAVELESGQQRGGHYYCSGCAIHQDRTNELDHAFRCPPVTFKERQEFVLQGPVSRARSLNHNPNPFSNLSKDELEREVRGRGLEVKNNLKSTMQAELSSEMKGRKRVPALLYFNPKATLESINIEDYEVLTCEPMHDLSGHINNILQELPCHLPERESALMKDTVKLASEGKDKKRACDQRCSLIIASSQLRKKVTLQVQQLLDTLVDMQEMLYASADLRSPRQILRYHNQSFLHAILCTEVIGYQPSTITRRKLYGKYFHGLISHAPPQLRIISGKAINAEDEERLFNAINSITNATSSNHPNHIIGNILIRLQAEEELQEINRGTRSYQAEQKSKIQKLADSLPEFLDTIFPPYILEKYPREWQAHLERISDFLFLGSEGKWWSYDGRNVIFHDSKAQPTSHAEGPLLHHFRSSSVSKEESYLKSCWSECLHDGATLPAHHLFLPDKNNADKVIKVATGFPDITVFKMVQ
ncbi:hypothetical protein QZH41_010105 [Actinostola sp. cb2023]|nr:hypothetical protein QZH41_010105 [Actinostola sp. cb2023]